MGTYKLDLKQPTRRGYQRDFTDLRAECGEQLLPKLIIPVLVTRNQ
jgi:hypothetical protein